MKALKYFKIYIYIILYNMNISNTVQLEAESNQERQLDDWQYGRAVIIFQWPLKVFQLKTLLYKAFTRSSSMQKKNTENVVLNKYFIFISWLINSKSLKIIGWKECAFIVWCIVIRNTWGIIDSDTTVLYGLQWEIANNSFQCVLGEEALNWM